jgi:hypothetical protein
MHRRLGDVIWEVSDIKVDIATITGQMSESKAVTDQVKQWKLMGLGALGVVGIAAGALGTIIATYWHDILKMLRGSSNHPVGQLTGNSGRKILPQEAALR